MPWDPAEIERLGELADSWVTRRTAETLRPRLAAPDVQATMATAGDPNRPTYVALAEDETIVRRRDAINDVTINGTTFRAGSKGSAVVLVDRDKLEERGREAEGLPAPGRHPERALRYGDYVDVNRPVRMARMADPDDFRQGWKMRALSDRGFGAIPVEVAPEAAPAIRKALGVKPSTRRAVEERAGETMVDARSWAEGIIGRGRSIERAYLGNVDEAVRVAQREGQGASRLAQTLQKKFGMAKARSRFVARDRMGSLNASITRSKHTRLGFQFYRWVTSDDSRVRPEHAALHDTIRPWASPHPTEGHPGDAPNCRCVAIPVTVDEYNRERRKNRAAAVAVGVLGVAAAIGIGLALRRGRVVPKPHRVPTTPTTTPKPQRPQIPQRPAAAAKRTRVAGVEMDQRTADIIQFPRDGAKVLRRNRIERWRYANRITNRIREAERAAGKPLSDRRITFGAALKAIRDAQDDADLARRLAKIAGDRGQMVKYRRPTKPGRRVKFKRARGRARNTRRNR